MTELSELKTEIRQIATLVDAARRLVLEGQLIELGRLESRVEACCAAIGKLPRADGVEIQPALLALLDDLGRLEQTMRTAQAETTERLGEAGRRRRAVAAYGGGAGER